MVISGSSQIVPDSVLPNLVPSALVISGVASACTTASDSTRWIRSVPEVRLPHWSLPPVWSVQPCRRYSSRKSIPWRIW